MATKACNRLLSSVLFALYSICVIVSEATTYNVLTFTLIESSSLTAVEFEDDFKIFETGFAKTVFEYCYNKTPLTTVLKCTELGNDGIDSNTFKAGIYATFDEISTANCVKLAVSGADVFDFDSYLNNATQFASFDCTFDINAIATTVVTDITDVTINLCDEVRNSGGNGGSQLDDLTIEEITAMVVCLCVLAIGFAIGVIWYICFGCYCPHSKAQMSLAKQRQTIKRKKRKARRRRRRRHSGDDADNAIIGTDDIESNRISAANLISPNKAESENRSLMAEDGLIPAQTRDTTQTVEMIGATNDDTLAMVKVSLAPGVGDADDSDSSESDAQLGGKREVYSQMSQSVPEPEIEDSGKSSTDDRSDSELMLVD